MKITKRSLLAVAPVALVIAGCGSGGSPPIPSSGQLESVKGSPYGKIVLSQLGAQRIGLQTAAVRHMPAPGSKSQLVIPYSAVVYNPGGQTFAFTQVKPLVYREVPVKVSQINGNSAYLKNASGIGTTVVTVGAEELYGVQTGVLAQT